MKRLRSRIGGTSWRPKSSMTKTPALAFHGPNRRISTGPRSRDDPRGRMRPSVSAAMSRKKASRRSRPATRREDATESSTATRPPVQLATRRYGELPMPKLEVSAAVVMRTTPEHAFDYFADNRHVARVLEGVTRWEPIGSRSKGVGARYNVEMVAMGFPLRSVLRLNRWRRPHEIGWVSESGLIKQEGGFTFTET